MEYPREESETEAPSGEEMQKRSKYLMVLVTAIVLVISAFLFRDLIFKSSQLVIPTPLASPTATPIVFQPMYFEFEPREYDVNDNRIVFEHALSITESGRNELLTFTNYGNETASFSLVEVIPSSVYDENYRELAFQDEPSQVVGFRILVRNFTLAAGESKNLRLKSNSKSVLGLVFLVVTDPSVDVNELKSILEKQVSEGRIRLLELSPAEAKLVAKQINDLVNDASKTWRERKNELESIAAAYGTEVGEYNASFVALASEMQPGALIQIPVFGTDGLNEIVYKIEGDLSQYASIETQKSENFTILNLFFDFRNGLNSGRIAVTGGNIDLSELNGTLVVSFPQLRKEQRFPLKVLFNNIPAGYFVILSPRNVFADNEVTIINNLPFDLQNVTGCGLQNSALERNSVLSLKLDSKDGFQCALTQNGKILQTLGFSTEENYSSREFNASWLSCSDSKCDCDTFSAVALLIEEQVFENSKFASDPEAFEKLFGTREYSFKLPIQTESGWDCELPMGFESVKTLAGSKIMLTITATVGEFPPVFKIAAEKR